jgi:hypothetical protein
MFLKLKYGIPSMTVGVLSDGEWYEFFYVP